MVWFSLNLQNKFENSAENYARFQSVMMDAANEVVTERSIEDASTIIRNQFNAIMGCDNFKDLSSMKQRQLWRDHGKEIASLVETTVADKMVSGWNANNAFFADLVEEINLAAGDKNEFYVEDDSMLVVSKFAADHHDICQIVSV